MKKEVLESIEGVEIYPMISFAIFGVFFLVTAIWVFTMKKDFVNKMSSLPLNKDESKKK